MIRFIKILVLTGFFTGSVVSAHAQKAPERTGSGRAAYGDTTPSFRANKKKNQKTKKKARKSAKRKKRTNTRSSYFTGRPF
ncbi:MAG TPA: hypothetical protein VD816_18200 [Ohtaekwangia sp.]|nr:hypothetical protein [Ohtaekwangia sp.]